jgi:hypothetical protein
MDLIASLSSQLGLDPERAQGLAGAVLGKLEEQVHNQLGSAEAAALRCQVPELEGWKAKISALGEGGGVSGAAGSPLGGGGGLLGAAGGLLGGAGGLLGGAGGLLGGAGGLLGGAGGLLGGGRGLDVASLLQLAAKAGLGGGAAEKLVPIVMSFLKSRLDPALLAQVLSVVPGLEKFTGGSGGLGGLFGGILG